MAGPVRVLLVDDEEVFLQSIARVLRKKGMETYTASDGASGLKLLREVQFDVIVLDVRMPGMDGLATLEEIRRRDPGMPVLLLSGHIQIDEVAQAVNGGAAEVLLKPCPIEDLVAAIENAWKQRASAPRP